MKKFAALAGSLGMDSLYEIHTESDLRKVLPLRPRLLGINNRDLRTFHVNLETTGRLARKAPRAALLVSESGIQGPEDLVYLKKLGVKAVLVGESLMKEKKAGRALQRLLGR
jgi:indole-3-glycerol phosphate synthase